MTMPSRGIPDIQKQARGNDMKKAKKVVQPMGTPSKDKMSVGPFSSKSDMGMKCGGKTSMKCGGKAYKKGGSIDGTVKKGHTKGKIC